jgi:hypothetical protein
MPQTCTGDDLVTPRDCTPHAARYAIVSMTTGAMGTFTLSWL